MAYSTMDRESRLSRISSRTDTEIFDDGKGEKRHTIFYMNIEVGRNKYYLHKRYTEFLMLHQKLCEQQYPEIEDFDFPVKVWFNNFSDSVIEYRRTRFEAYLTLLLELVNKYPPLRKEVESFLGVPQIIDAPKKYPKTPVPGRRAVDKPLALLDDSATSPSTSAAALAAGNDGSAAVPYGQRSFMMRRRSSTVPEDECVVNGGALSPSLTSTASPSTLDSCSAAGTAHACCYTSSSTILAYLFLYIFLVALLALAAALDPVNARAAAFAILALSGLASILVLRAFSVAVHDGAAAAGSRKGGKRA